MKLKINNIQFKKDMKNIIEYSEGFLDGTKAGKTLFFRNLSIEVKNILEQFIDSNASVSPQTLHHMYEWNQVGQASGRLFNINSVATGYGINFTASFNQSQTIKDGSRVPFYDKARIVEFGIPVVIKPKTSNVLVFEDNGDTVFTAGPINVNNPGGDAAQGGFEKTFNMFFSRYLSQAFLRSTGVASYLERPMVYKSNLQQGKRMGRSAGYKTGYRWIANAGMTGR
jgi:hypothetical protein